MTLTKEEIQAALTAPNRARFVRKFFDLDGAG